jgi:transposase InsO family protein
MLNEYMVTYNTCRPHSSLGGACPADYYLKSRLTEAA